MASHLDILALSVVAILCAWGWRRAAGRAEKLAEEEESVLDELYDLRDDLRESKSAAERAESACELLRQSVIRGSSVAHVTRHNAHRRADRNIEVITVEGRYRAFTDSGLPYAAGFYDQLVSTGQIQPLPPIR